MREKMKKQKAFTLIELLVVIAMIAVLMAILMPALRAAKDQGKKAVCTSHVKGLVLALKMYTDDYNGNTHIAPNNGLWDNAWQHPTIVTQYGPNDSYAYWGISYFPYARNKKIFYCPGKIRVDDWPEWGAPWGRQSQEYFKYCSYGLNSYVARERENPVTKMKRPTNIYHDFKKHSEVIAYQDHIEQRLDGIDSDMFCIAPGNRINIPQWRRSSEGGQGFVDSYWSGDQWHDTVKECFRHRGSSMTVWLDGHVTEIKETTGEEIPPSWYTGNPVDNL